MATGGSSSTQPRATAVPGALSTILAVTLNGEPTQQDVRGGEHDTRD